MNPLKVTASHTMDIWKDNGRGGNRSGSFAITLMIAVANRASPTIGY